ncbi:MAG TPA: FliM/FliN family flagellar motor C-terminal domain-containing protein [Bryobacteraceae bacterium]|nr:FliM/FliN family flagellar motor C-terminal domain-containing protein [Bryobacteraceae bacterium]
MSSDAATAAEGIDQFWDIPVTIEAQVDERMMELDEVRKIEPGDVIALQRVAGETLDVYVGNVRFAVAEVVVIEDTLALRITEFEGLEQ